VGGQPQSRRLALVHPDDRYVSMITEVAGAINRECFYSPNDGFGVRI
jgi:hypothetical protein